MKTTHLLKLACLSLLLAPALQSCNDSDHVYQGNDKPKEEFFDFSTTAEVNLMLDYGFQDYQVIFELFEENPITATEVDGTPIISKTTVDPLYRSITDKKGVFNNVILLPAYVGKVYLYSDDIGTVGPVEIEVVNNAISFNQKEYLAGKQSQSARKFTTRADGDNAPEGYLTLGGWDATTGRPDYLMDERRYDIPSAFIRSIRNLYGSLSNTDEFPVKYPEYYVEDKSIDLHIIENTEVEFVFLQSGAAYKNAVGYYTYPTNNPPASRDEIQNPIIAFPQITTTSSANAGVYYGDQVKLKYYDPATGSFSTTFPKGTSIGFFIISEGFNGQTGKVSESNSNATFYSTNYTFSRFKEGHEFLTNDVHKQRAVALLHDQDTKQMISITFEDRMSTGLKKDYYDAGFYIHIKEPNAIEGEYPELPQEPDPGQVTTVYRGTLAFEDLWPSKGDYDMNDVVIEYKSTHYYNPMGGYNVIKVVDEFTPRHNGADYINSFGYQLYGRYLESGKYVGRYTTEDKVRKVTIESPDGKVSKYMQGKEFEPGHTKGGVIMLFDNIDESNVGKTYTVTIEMDGIYDRYIWPPYNPFIVVDQNRGREVHLINYPPTELANLSLLGTHDDRSRADEELYYVSDYDYPFAIHIANASFSWPVEKTPVDEAYPLYEEWAKSKGTVNKNWYLKPIWHKVEGGE